MADSDNDSGGHNNKNSNNESSAREQDRLLPIANVSRRVKKALPANAKISEDAKETGQECVSEFISFIPGEASDKCQREKRKTINGDDLLRAMTTLGFEGYADPLKIYLHKFREMQGERTAVGLGLGGLGRQTDQRDGSAAAALLVSMAPLTLWLLLLDLSCMVGVHSATMFRWGMINRICMDLAMPVEPRTAGLARSITFNTVDG